LTFHLNPPMLFRLDQLFPPPLGYDSIYGLMASAPLEKLTHLAVLSELNELAKQVDTKTLYIAPSCREHNELETLAEKGFLGALNQKGSALYILPFPQGWLTRQLWRELASKLGAKLTRCLGLAPARGNYKLAVFCPPEAVTPLRKALTQVGCGEIGGYTACSFTAHGVGTFIPPKGSHPHKGETGKLSEVLEFRLEMELPVNLVEKAVEVMYTIHPYEVVAYDLYPRVDLEGSPAPAALWEVVSQESFAAAKLEIVGDKVKDGDLLVVSLGGYGDCFPELVPVSAKKLLLPELENASVAKSLCPNLEVMTISATAAEHLWKETIADFLRRELTGLEFCGH
jgi:hypothetical protein